MEDEQAGQEQAGFNVPDGQHVAVVDHNAERAELQEQAPILGYAHDVEPDYEAQAKEETGEVGFNSIPVETTRPVVTPEGDDVEKVTEQKDELPADVGPKLHPEYPEKPLVQEQNERLTDAHPTGYVPTSADEWKDKAEDVSAHERAGQDDGTGEK